MVLRFGNQDHEGGDMDIRGSVFTAGNWQALNNQGIWDGTTTIEKVKFELVGAPHDASVLYQVVYWDKNTKKWTWTAARSNGDEVGVDGSEIFGVHIMLTNPANATTWVAVKTMNGWGAAHNSLSETENPVLGLNVKVAKP
jgi:hypothetical protein